MPKRGDIKSILIIGSGPIVIGQACEFDYAGTQACKALQEEGYRTILINSNPATIMTDPEIATVIYIEPITLNVLKRIIEVEKPDALLPTLGGQTALNCALALAKSGVLEKYHVELIGASIQAIELAENRNSFQALIKEMGLNVLPMKKISHSNQIEQVLDHLNFPVIIRLSYALGGSGMGIAHVPEEFKVLCQNAFRVAPTQEITIEKALIGWKEFELEVIRDKKDNCIVVCGLENFDPMGIHTGDSITVSPIQTLTDKEYQSMREAAFAIMRAVGIDSGGGNVQFAIHPTTGEMQVIEMNPRVSRSSALASKATGFPIARIAAKLAVGYTLDELKNEITGNRLPASFEPSVDYVVVKIPRFDFDKFRGAVNLRGPQMQSVGEVMSIGRTFPEALQKAMRSLEIGKNGFCNEDYNPLLKPEDTQLWAIAEALRQNRSIDEINKITHVDPWFLEQINFIVEKEKEISLLPYDNISPKLLREYKRLGFSDARLAILLDISEKRIFNYRQQHNIKPVYMRIDSCAGEFFSPTAYFYSSYETICESHPSKKKKIIIIGSGPNRIGQGIEFDYCCVHAAKALRKRGYETIMLNCNPETVSTDYDVVDRLYCTPLVFEDVMEIIAREQPLGVLVQYGGQTPLQLSHQLFEAGTTLLGLEIQTINQTEDRQQFRQLLCDLKLIQPKNYCVSTIGEGKHFGMLVGFPLIVRPSFVLGGASMSIVTDLQQLEECLKKIFSSEARYPVLLEIFLDNAIEIEIDVISDGEEIFIPAFLEHIEPAGIHSGDSACITPTISISQQTKRVIKEYVKKIAVYLKIKGLLNIQFAIQGSVIYILDVNPRASRTVPFLCKATGLPLVDIAVACTLGASLKDQNVNYSPELSYYSVKEAVFPFIKFPQTPVLLGPEMKSTGEVMGIGKTPEEAYGKAQMAAGNKLPKVGNAWVIGADFTGSLHKLGFSVYTGAVPPEGCVLILAINDMLKSNPIVEKAIRYAVNNSICYATTLKAANLLLGAIAYYERNQDENILNYNGLLKESEVYA